MVRASFWSTMPSSSIIRAACFAVGALVGGGAVAALQQKRQSPVPIPAQTSTTLSSSTPSPSSAPVVKTGPNGLPDLAKTLTQTSDAVLRYGNPG